MPLNNDPNALTDDQYNQLLADAEATAEPCPAAVPPDQLEAALARLESAGAFKDRSRRGD
jgi:hypothetical protein